MIQKSLFKPTELILFSLSELDVKRLFRIQQHIKDCLILNSYLQGIKMFMIFRTSISGKLKYLNVLTESAFYRVIGSGVRRESTNLQSTAA